MGEVNRQLDPRGFVIKRGTLVDATRIAGAVRRPYEGGVNPRDPEALFTRKRDKTYFGYNKPIWRWTKAAVLSGRPR